MKIQNILRTQAIVIGFGAALLLSSPAPAQEIVNTQFDDGPYVTTFAQPSPTVTTAAAPASTVADASTVSPAIAIPNPVVTDEAVVSLENSAAYGLITSAFFGLALLAVFAVGEFRRANRNLNESPSSPLHRRAALS